MTESSTVLCWAVDPCVIVSPAVVASELLVFLWILVVYLIAHVCIQNTNMNKNLQVANNTITDPKSIELFSNYHS